MLFSSHVFIIGFLPIFMLMYLLVPERFRNITLLAGSLIFYGFGEPSYIVLLLFSISLNYVLNLCIWRSKKSRSFVFAFIMILNFGMLFVFKYWDFFAKNLNLISDKLQLPLLSIGLPLGISFYTFQMVSYQIDCYRGKQEKRATFVEFATYVSMFPQLIAGPIVKYDEVESGMKSRRIQRSNLENGLKNFVFGLGLKVLLANQIGTLWNSTLSIGAGSLSVPMAWLGALAFSFQIYFDFWGYSLMAIGLGEMLGFQIPENFHNPYMAKSISEFWRRWHITLGRWFKEYVYIPLGGSKKGLSRMFFNTFLVWALTGLWHGASWNFVLWGLTFFLLISLEKTGYGKRLEASKVLGHLYVVILIPVTWIIFAVTDFNQLLQYMKSLIGIHSAEIVMTMAQFLRYVEDYGILILVCILFATPLPYNFLKKNSQKWYVILLLLVIFWFSVYEIKIGSNNPFLYFRF